MTITSLKYLYLRRYIVKQVSLDCMIKVCLKLIINSYSMNVNFACTYLKSSAGRKNRCAVTIDSNKKNNLRLQESTIVRKLV